MKNLAEILVYDARLTTREIEICLRLLNSESSLDMAKNMFISKKTIDYHFGKIFQKLGIPTRPLLIFYLDELINPRQKTDSSLLPQGKS